MRETSNFLVGFCLGEKKVFWGDWLGESYQFPVMQICITATRRLLEILRWLWSLRLYPVSTSAFLIASQLGSLEAIAKGSLGEVGRVSTRTDTLSSSARSGDRQKGSSKNFRYYSPTSATKRRATTTGISVSKSTECSRSATPCKPPRVKAASG